MLELIRQDLERYNQNNSHFLLAAIRAAYTHPAFIGVIWYRIGHALWLQRRNPLYFVLFVLHRILYPFIRLLSGPELSPRTQIGPGLYVAHFGPTVIHPDTIAGSHLTIMQGVTIGARKDGVPHLGNHVSITAGARVLGGIHLGDHVFVGAGAVVVKDVPSGCTVVGIPAKPVNAPEVLDALDGISGE